jgi:hypothetical protein
MSTRLICTDNGNHAERVIGIGEIEVAGNDPTARRPIVNMVERRSDKGSMHPEMQAPGARSFDLKCPRCGRNPRITRVQMLAVLDLDIPVVDMSRAFR